MRLSCPRRPTNRIGWVLCGITLGMGASQLASAYARYALITEAGRWPLGDAAAWISTWAFFPVVVLVLALVVLYPTGRPSRFGKWVLLAFIAVASLTWSFMRSDPARCRETLRPSPVGIPGTGPMLDSATEWLGNLLAVIALVAIVDVFQRFRSSNGVERLQFRWFFIAIAMFPILFLASGLLEEFVIGVDGFDPVVVALTLWGNGTAAAIGIAITRHGLYEIDRVVSRTVSYAVVVGLLTAVFFGLITLLTLVLPAGSDLATAASTLAVAALFNPVRRRTQVLVDRRFNRSRYDAQTGHGHLCRLAARPGGDRGGHRRLGWCGQRNHAAGIGVGLGEAMRVVAQLGGRRMDGPHDRGGCGMAGALLGKHRLDGRHPRCSRLRGRGGCDSDHQGAVQLGRPPVTDGRLLLGDLPLRKRLRRRLARKPRTAARCLCARLGRGMDRSVPRDRRQHDGPRLSHWEALRMVAAGVARTGGSLSSHLHRSGVALGAPSRDAGEHGSGERGSRLPPYRRRVHHRLRLGNPRHAVGGGPFPWRWLRRTPADQVAAGGHQPLRPGLRRRR